ncbi:MAG: low molecular weight protein arginine phosphatase [Firmicutes bacterium]|nr:low molecular weight protein arginine phosphatase [Bacillota bacterium]
MGRTLNVLFVCTGNTCRSVLAQAFLEEMGREFVEKGRPVEVSSAGVSTIDGLLASEDALSVLQGYGIDFSKHRSSRVTPELVQQAHYIFAMTHGQKDYLLHHFPEAEEKLWLLNEYAEGSSKEISDPYGEGQAAYRRIADEIREALAKIVARWDSDEKKGRE